MRLSLILAIVAYAEPATYEQIFSEFADPASFTQASADAINSLFKEEPDVAVAESEEVNGSEISSTEGEVIKKAEKSFLFSTAFKEHDSLSKNDAIHDSLHGKAQLAMATAAKQCLQDSIDLERKWLEEAKELLKNAENLKALESSFSAYFQKTSDLLLNSLTPQTTEALGPAVDWFQSMARVVALPKKALEFKNIFGRSHLGEHPEISQLKTRSKAARTCVTGGYVISRVDGQGFAATACVSEVAVGNYVTSDPARYAFILNGPDGPISEKDAVDLLITGRNALAEEIASALNTALSEPAEAVIAKIGQAFRKRADFELRVARSQDQRPLLGEQKKEVSQEREARKAAAAVNHFWSQLEQRAFSPDLETPTFNQLLEEVGGTQEEAAAADSLRMYCVTTAEKLRDLLKIGYAASGKIPKLSEDEFIRLSKGSKIPEKLKAKAT